MLWKASGQWHWQSLPNVRTQNIVGEASGDSVRDCKDLLTRLLHHASTMGRLFLASYACARAGVRGRLCIALGKQGVLLGDGFFVFFSVQERRPPSAVGSLPAVAACPLNRRWLPFKCRRLCA